MLNIIPTPPSLPNQRQFSRSKMLKYYKDLQVSLLTALMNLADTDVRSKVLFSISPIPLNEFEVKVRV